MVTQFNTVIEIELEPEGLYPIINYGIDSINSTLLLKEKTLLKFDIDLCVGQHKLILEFNNKTNSTPDLAVKINKVVIEGLCVDRFKWAGKYYPNYPEPWASQQKSDLPKCIDSATFLGWNGIWELDFSVPIFTWIHKLENLGWIYN